MGKLRATLKRIRLVYRRSSTLTKTVVMAAVVVSMVALLTLHIAIDAVNNRYESDRDKAAQLEQENEDLKDKNDAIGSIDGALDYADDELGMKPPGSIVIIPGK